MNQDHSDRSSEKLVGEFTPNDETAVRTNQARAVRKASAGSHTEPRLGIIHLMNWILCVAVHLGLIGLLTRLDPSRFGRVYAGTAGLLFGVFNSASQGAALAGLIMWAARRRRGVAFPVHPGEYLLVLTGVFVVMQLGFAFVLAATPDADGTGVLAETYAMVLLFYGLLWVWAAFQATVRRWRVLFWFVIAGGAVQQLLVRSGRLEGAPAAGRVMFQGLMPFILAAAILFVVWKDRREGNRYAWTHWVGVVVVVWTCLFWATMTAVFAFLHGWFS
jgi:hypothetical protein